MFSNKIVIFSSSKLVEKKVVEKIISQCLSLSNSKLMFLFELIDFSLHFRGRTVGQRSNCPKHELTSDQMTSSLHEVKRWDHRCDYTHTHTHIPAGWCHSGERTSSAPFRQPTQTCPLCLTVLMGFNTLHNYITH